MEKNLLTGNLKLNVVSEEGSAGTFEIEGLNRGYGLTIGNALRRVLLSSLPGAAITSVKIKGVGHEFTTVPGVMEDVVEICLNLKKVRFAFHSGEEGAQEILTLKSKGEGAVTAADIKGTGNVQVINPDQHIATISTKGTDLEMELTVERGLGYVPVESFKTATLPVGVIQLDALFSPVTKVNFTVENMRVADKTDYNKLRLLIETDGGITPSQALKHALAILTSHFSIALEQLEPSVTKVAATEVSSDEAEEKKAKKKTTKKKKSD